MSQVQCHDIRISDALSSVVERVEDALMNSVVSECPVSLDIDGDHDSCWPVMVGGDLVP